MSKAFTLLLVDDRQENITALQALLDAPNRKFLHANNGNDALKLALKHDDIGLVMLDVQMPGMDGFEVANILQTHAKTKEIAIIFVTAINKEEQYALKGFEEGAVDYLYKPLDVNITKAKVNVFERLYFAQQAIKHVNEELHKVNKQLERFTYIVSHDLKSPLASVVTTLSIMRKHPAVEQHPDLVDKVEMVEMSAYQLTEMISGILEYSRQSLQQQELEEVDTYELLSQVIFLLHPPPHITINVSTAMPVLYTRKAKLQQVFQNLLSNALKYMEKEVGLIEVGASDTGDFTRFFVKDNGPGIDKNDQDRIFKLFNVAGNISNADSSTGVGLNILKVLVEEQGGKIWVDSEPGAGSTFYFEWRK